MKKVFRITGIVVLTLAVLGFGLARYLFARESVPDESAYRIDRAALAELARSLPGDLPLRINHQVVALVNLPRGAVFAGESMEPHRMVHGVYQVVYSDDFVLIDAAFGESFFEEGMAGDGNRYDAASFEQVKWALEHARAIIPTHEHGDHIEGLGRVEFPLALASKLVMNSAQLENPRTGEIIPANLLEAIEPIPGDTLHAVAPGIVVVPAPGHTPGSQLVYVLTQDGHEFLFVGDVAWHMDALRDLHYRPRLITDYFLNEDRVAVLDQFRTLHDLLEEPGLEIVVSHDADQRRALARAGILGEGIE